MRYVALLRSAFSGAINDCSGALLPVEVRFYHLFAAAANGRGGFHVTLVTNAQGEATNPALEEPLSAFAERTEDWVPVTLPRTMASNRRSVNGNHP
jgi:hypothetical protein